MKMKMELQIRLFLQGSTFSNATALQGKYIGNKCETQFTFAFAKINRKKKRSILTSISLKFNPFISIKLTVALDVVSFFRFQELGRPRIRVALIADSY